MKIKLLRKLRREANSQITFYSITKTNGEITGMSYGMNDDAYRGLFSWGNTEQDVMKKAAAIFFEINMPTIRGKYKKYSAKFKSTPPIEPQ